ncbi:MAG: hypothetical protein WA160_05940 [Pseudobdellovibrio sp.]
MKNLLLSSILLISISTFAHIDPGTWKGIVAENADCYMEVGAQTFENNLPHPLNERIAITIGSTAYSVHHPYAMNTTDGAVSFNHDLFEAVVPTSTGAFALQIKMLHTAAYEGPESLSVMEHNWKTGAKEILKCSQLKKVN